MTEAHGKTDDPQATKALTRVKAKSSAAVPKERSPRRRISKTPEGAIEAAVKPAPLTRSKASAISGTPKPARRTKARGADKVTKTEAGRMSDPALDVVSVGKNEAKMNAAWTRHALPPLAEDQPLGQAAREIARIRAEMQHIRYMIDTQPVSRPDARAMLEQLCRDPAPRGMSASGTGSVVALLPHVRRAPVRVAQAVQLAVADDDLSQSRLADALPEAALSQPVVAEPIQPQMPHELGQVPARSRIARLLSAWGDWLMWRLMPPPMAVPDADRPGPAPGDRRTADAQDADLPPGPQPTAAAVIPFVPQPTLPLQQIVTQSVARIMDDGALRDRLQEMIREELEGEMGTRFSGNLRAVLRREIASAMDERLTHL